MKSHIQVDSYELSPLQQGMLYNSLSAPRTGVDIEQIIITIREFLDIPSFKKAWEAVVKRHAVLRTCFEWENSSEPRQVVFSDIDLPFSLQDWTNIATSKLQKHLESFLTVDRLADFTLSTAPLLKITLIKHQADFFYCVWTFHHAILDGRSFPHILNEVFSLYEAIKDDVFLSLPEPCQYSCFVEWLKNHNKKNNRLQEQFWRNELKGFSSPTPIKLSLPSLSSETHEKWGGIDQRLPVELTAALKTFAREHHLTLNTLLQGAWSLLLCHYSSESDIVFGATRACRHGTVSGAESMVGLFINTLPVRLQVGVEETLLQILNKLRGKHVDLRKYEHTPLADIQRWSELPPKTPLFESIIVFENYLLNTLLQAQGEQWSSREFYYQGQTNFPFALICYDDAELLIRIEYDPKRFSLKAVQQMHGHLHTLLQAFPKSAELPAIKIPYLSHGERKKLLHEWTATSYSLRPQTCIHNRFEDQAKNTPDKIAIVYEQEHITYGDLNRKANRLAHRLIELGIKPDALVGLYVERSVDMIVGILAVLKAGGAYVPVDPAYPQERTAFIFEDTGISVLLTQEKLIPLLPKHTATILNIDEPSRDAEKPRDPMEKNPGVMLEPDNLSYVIYTSGSTGKPKGVLITHANVMRLFDATAPWFSFSSDDVWTLFHSYAFDFSVWEIWGALLYGGALVIVPYWISRSPEAFHRLLIEKKVTVLNQTPSAFRQLVQVDQGMPPQNFALRYIIFGGEALELKSLLPWFDRYGDTSPQLINMFGITETTVHVTYRPIQRQDITAGNGSVIGIPIPDLKLYVLDQYQQPVPVGVPGELYVGGSGLARGYLNRPSLTRERFVPNPFTEKSSEKLYRTGDVVRYLDDGDLEYIGRCDFQVKIRGFRIELGEIENALLMHTSVREAIAAAYDDHDGNKRLAAYLTTFKDQQINITELRAFLKKTLPDHMIPSVFIPLESLPLTEHGKIDRKALPLPEVSRSAFDIEYVPPQTQEESILCGIWSQVLGRKQIGINDDFLSLGGDSIISLKIIAKAHQAGFKITPKQIFQHPTIASLASKINRIASLPQKHEASLEGRFCLTPVQRWFFEQQFANPHHWNQAFVFRITRKLNPDYVEQAFKNLMAEHDCLRLRFIHNGMEWEQEYGLPPAKVPFSHKDFSSLRPEEYEAAIMKCAETLQKSLNIHDGPMMQAALLGFNEDYGDRLIIVIHHLAVDGVSWQILVTDLESMYSQLEAGKAIAPASKTTSYKEWASLLNGYVTSEKILHELNFWNSLPHDATAYLPIKHHDRTHNVEKFSDTITVSLDNHNTALLLTGALKTYHLQINDVLVLALAQALFTLTGRHRFIIDMEGHGREDISGHTDLSRTIGWFTSIFPVYIDLSPDMELSASIKAIKEQMRRIPAKGIGYGALRYLRNAMPENLLWRMPSADILFNYLGQFDTIARESALFTFAGESTGPWHDLENRRTHMLEIIGVVMHGALEFRFIYSRQYTSEETIRALAADFKKHLQEAVRHCLAVDSPQYTTSDFPLVRLDQKTLEALMTKMPALDDILPLSPIQQLFYSIDHANSALGFEQWCFTIKGNLDHNIFRASWEHVVNQHSILRTAFISEGLKQPVQIICKRVKLPWQFYDVSNLDAAQQQKKIDEIIKIDRENPFDLTEPPLTRITLVDCDSDSFFLIWSTHHLEIDGWSWPLVLRDLIASYENIINNKNEALPVPPSYKDYIDWLSGQDFEESKSFWSKHLANFSAPTPLPGMGLPTAAKGSDAFGECAFVLTESSTQQLLNFARGSSVTPGTVVQLAWACVLSAASGMKDIVFGSTVSGRPTDIRDVDNIIGPFVNNIPVRLEFSDDADVHSLLRTLQGQQLELAQHQHTPLIKIHQHSSIPLQKRLFESLVVYQNYAVDEKALCLNDHFRMTILSGPQSTNYPLTILAYPGKTLQIAIVYKHRFFSRDIVSSIAADMQQALAAISESRVSKTAAVLSQLFAWGKSSSHGIIKTDNFSTQAVNRSKAMGAPKTDYEEKIAGVWKDAFNRGTISIYDNFFDLGAHSLLIISVHEKLEVLLGVQFPITKMFEYPTVNSLAAYLSASTKPSTARKGILERSQRRMNARMKRHASIKKGARHE